MLTSKCCSSQQHGWQLVHSRQEGLKKIKKETAATGVAMYNNYLRDKHTQCPGDSFSALQPPKVKEIIGWRLTEFFFFVYLLYSFSCSHLVRWFTHSSLRSMSMYSYISAIGA